MRIHPAETFLLASFTQKMALNQYGTKWYVAKPFVIPGDSSWFCQSEVPDMDGWQQELDCCCQRHQRNQQTWRVKLFHQQKSRVWGSNEIEEISISNRWHFILGGYPKWQPSRLADSLCPWVIPFYKSQGCCMLYSHKDDSKWDKQIHRKCLYNLVLKATGLEIKLSASNFSYIHVQKPQKCVLTFQYFPLSQNEFQENKTSAHLHYWITSHRENQYLFLTKQNHSLAHTLTGIGTSGWFAGLVKIWSN